MPQYSSKKIEKAAVLAVKGLIQQCETIEESIPESDKEPLVDGCLELYSSSDQRNSNLVGKFWVQVKGTVSKLKRNKRGFHKYSIPVKNLQKYLEVFHGVLFFCVTVGGGEHTLVGTDVYYAQLLPYDIDRYLQSASGQKTVSVRFKPFPKDPREITRLVRSFHADREKQLKARVAGFGFLDEDSKLPPDINSWEFTIRVFPDEPLIPLASFSDGPYIYSKDAGGNLAVIGKMQDVCSVGVGDKAEVTSGDFSLTTTLFLGQSEEGSFIEFEGVRIVPSGGKARIDYTIGGGFRKRYNTVAFMREFYRTGEMLVNGKQIITASVEHKDRKHGDRLDKYYAAYSRAIETMDALRIKADWDPAKMTNKEIRDFEYMHYLLVEKKPYKGRDLGTCLIYFDMQAHEYTRLQASWKAKTTTSSIICTQRICISYTPTKQTERKAWRVHRIPCHLLLL